MTLLIEIIILGILILILISLFVDQKRLKTVKSPSGKITEYWDGTERRRSIRVRAELDIKYSVNKKLQEKKNSFARNISLGGILMRMGEKLLPATQLSLDIFLPLAVRPISARGEVVWVRELAETDEKGRRLFDAGIKFISMNPKDRERLDKYIKHQVK